MIDALPFRLGRRLGAGSMAEVFEAERGGVACAVKIVLPQVDEALDRHLRERLVREIEIASAFAHPRLMPVLASGAGDPRPWYAMPLLPRSLRDEMTIPDAGGPPRLRSLPLAETGRLLRQLLDGLAEMHARGFLHRDVRPANVRLTQAGQVVLGDFGIAVGGDYDRSLARSGVGVPGFSAPEFLAEPASAGPTADVYSAAAIAFAMLTARFAEPDTRLPQSVPEPLRGTIERALRTDPEERWKDAHAFLDAFAAPQ